MPATPWFLSMVLPQPSYGSCRLPQTLRAPWISHTENGKTMCQTPGWGRRPWGPDQLGQVWKISWFWKILIKSPSANASCPDTSAWQSTALERGSMIQVRLRLKVFTITAVHLFTRRRRLCAVGIRVKIQKSRLHLFAKKNVHETTLWTPSSRVNTRGPLFPMYLVPMYEQPSCIAICIAS